MEYHRIFSAMKINEYQETNICQLQKLVNIKGKKISYIQKA